MELERINPEYFAFEESVEDEGFLGLCFLKKAWVILSFRYCLVSLRVKCFVHEYLCLQICNIDDIKIIDCIYTYSKLIFQSESNKYYTKTENQNKQSRAKMTKSLKQTNKY
ncbi:hypothetical protein MtrunA17_Chr7g0251261 [Medicago truncatula]|uniref:Uncharacterized protein n=1 Tax=Medicago truncatula TaxID=3880 RepID=A0A396H1P5_MEDTR|nr:hypothetical protein MtrunA17_Chr7g0251261 [Medicago truncatula]